MFLCDDVHPWWIVVDVAWKQFWSRYGETTNASHCCAKYDDEQLNLVLEGLKDQYDFECEIKGKKVYIN